MPLSIFGISNDGLNLFVSLFVLMLVVVWLALIVYTYLDAKRRISDSFLVGCATLASFFPYIGTAVYVILRPPEFIEDARERELEIKAAELRVRQLSELSCPKCGFPTEKSYLRCPNCEQRLKDPCESCGKPVDPQWAVCPHCEAPLAGRARRRREGQKPTPRPKQKAPARRESASRSPRPPKERKKSAPTGSSPAQQRESKPDPEDKPARSRGNR